VGCNECNQKGYLGRTVIQELLMVTEEVRSLIMKRVDSGQIKKAALMAGMEPMREHGVQKVIAGLTTIEEVISNTQLDE
jgi:general secretion pathway protein E